MEINQLIKTIEDNYDIKIIALEKIKNTYKVNCIQGQYCIKIIKYEFAHFYFILSAIKHLQRRGFETIPTILQTRDFSDYIKLDDKFAYLTEWIPSRTSNYSDLEELALVSRKLGELHRSSKGFVLKPNMKPRIGWYSWIEVFNTRCNEILDFNNRISQKAYKSEFDKIYSENTPKEIERGLDAIEGIRSANYYKLMDKEVMSCGFCHHDYAHHNILIDDKGKVNIIDFDYCILDSHIHDVASLLIRTMKDGNWSKKKADIIINNYLKTNNITKEELILMKSFMKFPQGFWQIGLQYYWEQQLWNQSVFIKKISKYLDDVEEREKFLSEYFL